MNLTTKFTLLLWQLCDLWVKDCKLNQASSSSQTEIHPNTLQTNKEVVGHIPLRMVYYCINKFLKRRTNKSKVVVTGKRVNRGAGYGLEIPCEYIFSEKTRHRYLG